MDAESVLEERIQNINAKTLYLKEREKLLEDMENKITYLQSALSSLKVQFFPNNLCWCFRFVLLLELLFRFIWIARLLPIDVSKKKYFESGRLKSKVY